VAKCVGPAEASWAVAKCSAATGFPLPNRVRRRRGAPIPAAAQDAFLPPGCGFLSDFGFRISDFLFASLLCLALVSGCSKHATDTAAPPPQAGSIPPSPPSHAGPIPWYTYEVVHTWPHDHTAFTEGLVYFDGAMYESTGLVGQSKLRKYDLQTGKIQREIDLPEGYFGEGLAILNGKAYQLTYKTGKAFVYDLNTFNKEGEFNYDGEGWGMTTDGKSLIMDNGSEQIFFRDPATFAVQRTINVIANGHAITNINELEYIKGELFANVWKTMAVLRIDPATGQVLGAIDFTGLLAQEDLQQQIDVMNGIAYDTAGDRLFVTGKWWPKIYEVRLKPKPAPPANP